MQNAFELKNVSKRYSEFYLESLSLQLPVGQVMGLVGVNGAGKSTTLRLLMGLIQPDTGSVDVLGYRLPEQQVLAKENIGFASDDMRLYKTENLRWHMQLIQSIFPLWDATYAEHLLKVFDLNAEQKFKGFSHGQRVKACLLLILARKPKLVILDEPTTGLDPVAREEVLSELADILRDENRSVLFSSHNTQDIEQLSDSITFLHKGKLLDSQDKETYLDRWRRIVCTGDINFSSLGIDCISDIKRNGSLNEIIVNQYDDSIIPQLSAQGLNVSSVDRMSLEKIFVANVRAGAKS
uniref:ABC transporter ATP-binding protein n=1 Tax=uncultured organism TaxID=155900 RepID=D8VN36_9ZZZZ|nr:ABC transporter ATP-binding protein [uncultured organism]